MAGAVTILGIRSGEYGEHLPELYQSSEHFVENRTANSTQQSQCLQNMALRFDWSSLDNRAFYVMKGDGFVVNNYAHPSYVRYIEGNHLLSLSYQYVDETAQRGRRFLIFRNYTIQVQVPGELCWDNGTLLTESEAATVLDRICRTLTQYKKRPCRVVVHDKLYEQIAAAQRTRRARRTDSSQVANQ